MVRISRSKGKVRAGFFVIIIIINQGAKAPRRTLASTMFRNGMKLSRTS